MHFFFLFINLSVLFSFTFGQGCPNCLYGCDQSTSCYNASCVYGYYGVSCITKNPVPQQPSIIILSPCFLSLSVPKYNGTANQIYITDYFVAYSNQSLAFVNSSNYFSSFSVMLCGSVSCSCNISISGNYVYTFAVYFTFTDQRYIDAYNSSFSILVPANCSTLFPPITGPVTSSVAPTTPSVTPTTPSVTSTTISSVPTSSVVTTTTTTPTTTTQNPYYPTNFVMANNTHYSIYVMWMSPQSGFVQSYLILANWSTNQTQSISLPASSTSFNISNLPSRTLFNITLTAIFPSSITLSTSTIGWTKPLPFDFELLPPLIQNIQSQSFTVTFPTVPASYNGKVNLFYVIIFKSSGQNRRKREVPSCNAPSIPNFQSGGTVYYANSTQPSAALNIGSNQAGMCNNSPLQSNVNYTVYAIVGSAIENQNGSAIYTWSVSSSTTSFTTSNNAFPPGAIAAIIILLILLITIAVLLYIFLYLRKRKERDNLGPLYLSKDSLFNRPKSYEYWTSIDDKMEPRQINLTKTEYVGITMNDEFESLPKTYGYQAFLDNLAGVKGGTRYKDYDIGSKVMLRKDGAQELEYLHASVIDGYKRKGEFLVAPYPLGKNGCDDFWLMVFQKNVGQIVLLSESLNRAQSYWPIKREVYGSIDVKLNSETHYAHFIVRTFVIENLHSKSNDTEIVFQYHFIGMSDDNLPISIYAFLDFFDLVCYNKKDFYGPVVVHSTCGFGICGVFVTTKILKDQHDIDREVNVYRTVGTLQRFNPKLVDHKSQYMLIYDLLFESYLSSQHFIYLRSKIGRKNAHDLLLSMKYSLNYQGKGTSNRNCFDSVVLLNGLFLQASYPRTEVQFNRFCELLIQHKIAVVVDLDVTDVNEIDFIKYQTNEYQFLVTDLIQDSKSPFINMLLSLKSNIHNQAMDVSAYLSVNRDSKQSFSAGDSIHGGIDILTWVMIVSDLIENYLDRNILFLGEANICGLFMACFNSTTKFQRSEFVNIYNVVKSLRSINSEIMMNPEYYEHLLKFLDFNSENQNYQLVFKGYGENKARRLNSSEYSSSEAEPN